MNVDYPANTISEFLIVYGMTISKEQGQLC
jgi:hypothetical protein